MLAAVLRRSAPAALNLRFASTAAAATVSSGSKAAHLRDVATPRAPRALSEEARTVKDSLRRFDFGRPKSRSSGSFGGPTLDGANGQAAHAQFSHSHTEAASVMGGR